MEELKTLVDFVQAIGFTGLLILLALPKTRKFLGFGSENSTLDPKDIVKQITDDIRRDFEYDKPDRPALIARIPVICSDMKKMSERQAEMNNDISDIKEDMSYMRGQFDRKARER